MTKTNRKTKIFRTMRSNVKGNNLTDTINGGLRSVFTKNDI
jgi:hypothetical protein